MAIKLKRDEINLLINLLTQQMDRVDAAKDQYGFLTHHTSIVW
jgi:hypothetical protein